MKADLSPAAVAARLERLRVEVVLESVGEARHRLAASRVAEPSLARAAEQRLAELRSLCELTEYLQSRGKPSGAERTRAGGTTTPRDGGT